MILSLGISIFIKKNAQLHGVKNKKHIQFNDCGISASGTSQSTRVSDEKIVASFVM
jgi:hypothetical protein